MRFSTILVGVFAALAAAQSTSPTATPTDVATTTDVGETPAQSSAQSEIIKCLAACDASDVDCRAHCIAVPSPDVAQVNATTECVTACPQGNGTAAENLAYSNCVAACIGANYFTTSGTPTGTGAAAAGSAGTTATGTAATGTTTGKSSASGTASRSGSATSSGSASASATGSSAAGALRVGSSAVGLVGFLAAMLLL